MSDARKPGSLSMRFARWARRVRGRMAMGRVLTGVSLGLVAGAASAGALFWTGHGALRPWAASLAIVGGAAGFVVARRRRLSDGEVALLLDARLGSDEAIATALALDEAAPAYAAVSARAESALEGATPARIRTRVLQRSHAALPVAALALGLVVHAPMPPPKAPPAAPPGAERVRLADVRGLDKIIHLGELDARDDAQRERLRKLADDAKKLRDKLRAGVEKREAQADIAHLRDGITAERLSLGEGERRQGLESALGKLGANPDLKQAQRALGDRDLTELDDAMRKLANTLEQKDRERAKKTLEEAAEAARKDGAEDVAKALEEQKKLLEERGKQADALKELGKALGDTLSPEGKEALSELGRSGDPDTEKKLAKALGDAVGKLDDAQKKRLAEQMLKQLGQTELGSPKSEKQQMKDLAEQLETPEGQKQLEDQLRKMAEAPSPESGESQREQGLDDAQEGAGEAEQQFAEGAPMPVPVPGSGASGAQAGAGKDGAGKGDKGQPGHTEGGGPGTHEGKTDVVNGDGVRAKAATRIGRGQPMPGVVLGRTTGRAGETANVQGTGALGVVGPDEVGGVERSQVPEEYREQVGRYFEPK